MGCSREEHQEHASRSSKPFQANFFPSELAPCCRQLHQLSSALHKLIKCPVNIHRYAWQNLQITCRYCFAAQDSGLNQSDDQGLQQQPLISLGFYPYMDQTWSTAHIYLYVCQVMFIHPSCLCSNQCSRSDSGLSYKLKIFVGCLAVFFCPTSRETLRLSSAMQLTPLSSGSPFTQLTETFVLLQQKFKFYPHTQLSDLLLTHWLPLNTENS